MLVILSSLIIAILHQLAIAGGGGSSGGGGGGGSSGGSSGSSSGGGSGSGDPAVLIVFVIIFIVVFAFMMMMPLLVMKEKKAKRAKLKAQLELVAANDIVWEPGTLETHARDTFLQYQNDWSNFNIESMKTYMTPSYYEHSTLMMAALKLAARKNDVQNPVVLSSEVSDFQDDSDNSKDAYVVELKVRVQDVLIDTIDNTQLFSQPLSVVEYYKFKRSGETWLFDGIDQATANPSSRNIPLETFAKDNGLFYSLDWGHLLLPRRGQLFSSGSFGVSDINNHVIGLHNEIVIQLYTYAPNPSQPAQTFLIAQTSIPKSYGNIVVRRRKGVFQRGVKGLRNIKMEWQDFNSMYDVYASNEELATSFELLNPKFMEQLQVLPFEVNIEVVDNIVYLYAPVTMTASNEYYQTMLTILKTAFKEMRL